MGAGMARYVSGPPRQETCRNGHDRWYIGKNGDRQCAECSKERKAKARLCVHGHDDWIVTGGKRRCRLCERERDAKRRKKSGKTHGVAWGDYTRTGNRGPNFETFTRTEILKARGYAI